MSDDADHVLLTLPRGERGEVRLSRSRYAGRCFTRLHVWYRGADGELHPGRQVVTVRDHELAEVIAALQKIAAKVGDASARPEARARGREQRRGPTPTREYSDAEVEADSRLF